MDFRKEAATLERRMQQIDAQIAGLTRDRLRLEGALGLARAVLAAEASVLVPPPSDDGVQHREPAAEDEGERKAG